MVWAGLPPEDPSPRHGQTPGGGWAPSNRVRDALPWRGGGTPDLGPEVAFFSLTARLRQRPNLAGAPPYPACLGKLRE